MRRTDLYLVLGVLAFAGLAAREIASELGAKDRAAHPAAVHGDARHFAVRAVTDDGVAAPTAAQRQAAVAGVTVMQQWLGRHAGAVVTRDTEVRLTDHDHCGHDATNPDWAGVTVDGEKICLFTADTSELRVPHLLRHTAAHEAVHVLQHELGCAGRLPSWLVEGMAEDLSWRAVMPQLDRPRLVAWAAVQERLEDDGRGLNYGRAMGAVLELDHDRPATLVGFCRIVGQGAPWSLAFRQAFDAAPDRYGGRF